MVKQKTIMNKPTDLPKWLWLWLPIATVLLPYVARIINPATDTVIFGELGLIENMTVFFLVCALVVAIRSYKYFRDFQFSIFKFWIALLALGCFYYLGEELSWGQHWIGWATPEVWQEVNDQGETNLHNTSALLDQLPRSILTLAAVVGGIFVPIYFLIRNKELNADQFSFWLWPTYVNIPTCLAAVVVSLHKKAYAIFNTDVPYLLDLRAGEIKECLLALFLFMYLFSFYMRLKRLN